MPVLGGNGPLPLDKMCINAEIKAYDGYYHFDADTRTKAPALIYE